MTVSSLFGILRCPQSGAALSFVPAANQPFGGVTFGTLIGGVRVYPVIDDIPILLDGEVQVLHHVSSDVEARGPQVDHLVELVTSGRSLDALIELLTMPPRFFVARREVHGTRRLMSVPWIRTLAVNTRQRLLRRQLAGGVRRGDLTWWLALFHERSVGMNREIGYYFKLRTMQPRYLALQTLLPHVLSGDQASPMTVLDLACGSGHVCRDLHQMDPSIDCIGLDRTFYELWLAKHWIAPTSDFLCADAAGTLPLARASVSAVVCSDAFHYLPNAPRVVGELERICPGGRITLTRIANSKFEPHEGYERDPAGWVALFPDRSITLMGEDELINFYLSRTPLVVSPGISPTATEAKWLSLLTWRGEGPSQVVRIPGEYPHGRGQLMVNPAYRLKKTTSGVEGRLALPSDWFDFENGAMRAYHAPTFRMSTAELDDMKHGRRTPRIEELVSSFVLISSASDSDMTN